MADFGWTIDMEIIEKLRGEPLFQRCLLPNILDGEVFPTIRDGHLSFYYRDIILFTYDGTFTTNLQYAFVPQVNNAYQNVDETTLAGMKHHVHFQNAYSLIVDRCIHDQWGKEMDMGVSNFYRFSFATAFADRYFLLARGIVLNTETDDEATDCLLMDRKTGRLLFCMIKCYSNMENTQKYEVEEIVEPLKRYRDLIAKQRQAIIDWYGEYVRAIEVLTGIWLPAPTCLCDDCGLLICGFDEDQEKGKLKKIVDSLTEMGWPVYAIENIGDVTPEKLFKALARGGRVIEANRIGRV